MTEGERLAVLEQQMKDLRERYDTDMNEIKASLAILVNKFNQMTGGQKAWFALTTILGSVVGILGTISAMIFYLGGKHH